MVGPQKFIQRVRGGLQVALVGVGGVDAQYARPVPPVYGQVAVAAFFAPLRVRAARLSVEINFEHGAPPVRSE